MDVLVSHPQQHLHQSCHLQDRYNNITDTKLECSQQKLQNIMYNNNSNNKGGDFPQRSTHNPNSNNISNRDRNTNTNSNSNAMPSIVASGNFSSSAVAYQRNNSQYLMSNNPILVNGSTGPLMASSQLQVEQQRHQQQQQQQQRVLRTTVDDLELIRMKDNIEETIRIQDRLETIQRLQQAEALRTLQRGRFGNNGIGPGTVHSNNANLNNNNSNGHFVVPDIVRNNTNVTTTNNKNSSTTGSNSLNRGRGQDQSQSVIVPVQQREDERTMPINMKIHDALSTLSETAVALVNARSSSNKNTITPNNSKGSSFIANTNNIGNKMNVGDMIISNDINNNSSNKIMNKNNDHNDKVGIGIGGTHLLGALLGRTPSSKKRAASSTTTNATKDDALSREITTIQNKIHACAENNHQRPLYDTTTGSNNGTTASTPSLSLPSSAPSWLRNTVADATAGRVSGSGGTGNVANTAHSTAFEHLYQQQQKLQQHFQLLRRKNLLPSLSSTAITATNTASNTTGEFPSPRSQKRRRLEQKIQELQRRNSIDSLERSREMNLNLNMNNKNTFLAAAATGNSFTSPVVVQPQSHRPNINSSAASAGSIVASHSRATILSVNAVTSHALQEKLLVESLDRLCKNGGFPMPPIVRNDGDFACNQASSINDGPAKITLGANKGVVEVLDGGSSTRQRQRRHHGHQWNIGGFPMPPFAVDPSTDTASAYSNTNRKTNANNTQASRPPTLNLYKQLWRDIRVVAGDDPKIDERLRKEVFARKIQRGGFFIRSNNKNAHHQQQQQQQQRRRLGGIYNNSNNDNCNNGSQQMKKKTL